MALGAIRNFAMSVVAETAGEGGVLALVIAQFNELPSMAGYAWVGYIIAEGKVEVGMGFV